MERSELIMPLSLGISAFNSPRRILIGLDSAENVGREIAQGEGKNVLVVTDEGIRKAGIVDRVLSHLESEGLLFQVFDKVEADPHIEVAKDVAEIARSGGFDAVIGLGGGSSMDTAKAASFSVANPGKIDNYLGRGLIKWRGLPLLCIPTTAGTGSEVTMVAVFSVGRLKRSFFSEHIVPDTSLVDPGLTASMPPRITAGSGLDALSHAVEGLLSTFATPLTMAIGLKAVRLISENIRVAYHQGRNIEARYNMSLAATMAGLSFNDPGVVHGHSIAQTFGPIFNVPHGLSCAMTLPYIMDFYLHVCRDKLAQTADAMGVDTFGLTEREAAEAAIKAVHELNDDLDIPSLEEVGAEKKNLPNIAKDCARYWIRPNSPRPLTEKAALQILENMC